jgi:hypothetical protein
MLEHLKSTLGNLYSTSHEDEESSEDDESKESFEDSNKNRQYEKSDCTSILGCYFDYSNPCKYCEQGSIKHTIGKTFDSKYVHFKRRRSCASNHGGDEYVEAVSDSLDDLDSYVVRMCK